MEPTRSPLMTLTGIALIALPLIAWALKLLSFGWLLVFVLFGPVFVLLAGYALQVVIAVQGFLRPRTRLWTGPARVRATAAAWLTSAAVVVLGVFMTDGGDIGYGSTFQVWLGAYSDPEGAEAMHAATDGINGAIAALAAVVWIGGFLWLVVEWVAGLVRRRRARRAVADPGAPDPAAV